MIATFFIAIGMTCGCALASPEQTGPAVAPATPLATADVAQNNPSAPLPTGSPAPTPTPAPTVPPPASSVNSAPKKSAPPKPLLLNGSLSAEGAIEADELEEAPAAAPAAAGPPPSQWQAFKRRLADRTGITFSGNLILLWQNYSSSLLDQRDSVGGKFALNVNAPLVNRGKPHALFFDLAVESRGPLISDFPPLQAGIIAGSAVPTAATYGKFDLGITQAYIRQSVAGNRFQYTIGKIFAPNYVDAYPFFDDNRQYLNLAFSTNPTIASPLRGFGWVAAGFPGEGNLYLSGGMFTANSSDTGSTIGDFVSRNEHFYFVEVGDTSLARAGLPINARGPLDSNNIHLTLWYRDPLSPFGNGTIPDQVLRPSPDAYGVAFNINQTAGENAMWFLRAGTGKGSNFGTGAVAAGIALRPAARRGDLFGVGSGWTNPGPVVNLPIPAPRLRSQFSNEIFYRFALKPEFAITPDFQYLINPSLSPNHSSLTVFSMRARLVF